jgi:D-tyrosyl-tRNA(Tyr) deacylase
MRLLVSQFTLLAKTKKGTKPDFHGAANPEEASRLYHYFVQKVKDLYLADRVKDGKFQAMMEVALINDGPVSRLSARVFDRAKSVLILYLRYTGYFGAPSWCSRV